MFITLFGLTFVPSSNLYAQIFQSDTLTFKKQEQFYDSLKYKANRRKLTGWLYDFLISTPRTNVDKRELAFDYFNQYEGKVIAKINIQGLDVFGPTINDTTRKAKSWIERTANTIHTKSNLKTIRKQILFNVGDLIDPDIMIENERIIRQLPYIKDVRFFVEQDSLYAGFVNVTVLTKDRFSFGMSGGVSGTSSGDLELYNKNIFGIGHEFSIKFVGHIKREPYLGIETTYEINNIGGKFVDLQLGYLNTFRKEGYTFDLDKSFLTQDVKWGYGAHTTRMMRTDRISDTDPVELEDPIDLSYYSAWLGRSFPLRSKSNLNSQFVLSAGLHSINFFMEPDTDPDNLHFFSDRTLYMTSLTFSHRQYIQDQLVYSYGITEDIPIGFKNAISYGYDANQFGDRHYLHLLTSLGKRISNKKGYLFTEAEIGGYFNKSRFEEGLIAGNLGFISKLKAAGQKQMRSFANLDYTLGIRRFEIEKLTFDRESQIRGFRSDIATGTQRLTLKLEHVILFPKQFYKFNIAFFSFADLGVIGPNNRIIFKEDYYSGIGVGLRLHNENLVFETFRLRLAFYPFHPNDVNFIGFILDEQSKQRYNSFEPTSPEPIQFK